jgi:hypothetical protein
METAGGGTVRRDQEVDAKSQRRGSAIHKSLLFASDERVETCFVGGNVVAGAGAGDADADVTASWDKTRSEPDVSMESKENRLGMSWGCENIALGGTSPVAVAGGVWKRNHSQESVGGRGQRVCLHGLWDDIQWHSLARIVSHASGGMTVLEKRDCLLRSDSQIQTSKQQHKTRHHYPQKRERGRGSSLSDLMSESELCWLSVWKRSEGMTESERKGTVFWILELPFLLRPTVQGWEGRGEGGGGGRGKSNHQFPIDIMLSLSTDTINTSLQFEDDEAKASWFVSLAIEHNFWGEHFAILLEIVSKFNYWDERQRVRDRWKDREVKGEETIACVIMQSTNKDFCMTAEVIMSRRGRLKDWMIWGWRREIIWLIW